MSETTAVPNNNNVQKTLVVFKPDAVQRGIVGEILTRFERVGLKIVAVIITIATTRKLARWCRAVASTPLG